MLPLTGVKIVELYSRGPLQHAGMLLSDLGAEILVLLRPGEQGVERNQMMRGRQFEAVDLKSEAGRDRVLELVGQSDVLLEGNRPGVLERLGLGPVNLAQANSKIIIGRMTGWGQSGPLAHKAGHDINYIAETGALWASRTRGSRPTVALNLVGDNGGGSLYLVNGVLAALIQRDRTQEGCVIDAAIVDGTTSLLETVRSLRAEGVWGDEPHSNLFDSGAPFYDTYRCADGQYLAVGAIELKFYSDLLRGLGFSPDEVPDREDQSQWASLREIFVQRVSEKTLSEWLKTFGPLDACVSGVRSIVDAPQGAHLRARDALRPAERGHFTSAPAPRIEPLPNLA